MTAPDTSAESGPLSRSRQSKVSLKTVLTGLGGLIAGAVVGVGVQAGIEATGILGPSVDSLIEEQEANFTELHAQLEALQTASADPMVKESLSQLGELIRRQDRLAQQANAELRYLGQQVTEMKDEALAQRGYAGGADFWLKPGESVNVSGEDQVFAVIADFGGSATVNLSGARRRLYPGDQMAAASGERTCTVFFKQAEARADGRIGFDLSCAPTA